MTLQAHPPVRAVLFDLDDIVVGGGVGASVDTVRAAPGARRAMRALRAAGLPVGVVADAGGPEDGSDPVAVRLAELVGPFDDWSSCTDHGVDAHGRAVRRAAERLHVDPASVVLVGGSTADVGGAHDVGAASIVVSDRGGVGGTEDADVVVGSVVDAAALLLHRARPRSA
jgi:D-glycero-D-manno-heptose 1,7-bisphosphate phosphatase